MKPKYRNFFLVIGIAAIALMLCTFDMSYTALWENIKRAGHWFPMVILLWVPIYFLNTLAWAVIMNDGSGPKIPLWKIYKYTVTGFALNYVTPVGLLGGEPYRILELTPALGVTKATSSVILNAMMHIFSHFCFWAFSIVLYLLLYGSQMGWGMGVLMFVFILFCSLGIYFFMKGYRQGLAMKVLKFFAHIPFLKRKINSFIEKQNETINRVDSQIAGLHKQRKSVFYLSLFLQFMARILGCLEVQFMLYILTDNFSFWDSILIQAFTSLFANLFFFIPMEMGAREGGFALAVGGLALSGAYGVYTGLMIRVREFVWITLGIVLMKVGNKKIQPKER